MRVIIHVKETQHNFAGFPLKQDWDDYFVELLPIKSFKVTRFDSYMLISVQEFRLLLNTIVGGCLTKSKVDRVQEDRYFDYAADLLYAMRLIPEEFSLLVYRREN